MTPLQTLNDQPHEKPSYSDGSYLDVVSIFQTIQGEGPFVGQPAIFVRLSGCNLKCSTCDTDYTTGRAIVQTDSIVRTVKELSISSVQSTTGKINLVVITGGEPFRQTIGPFIHSLIMDSPLRGTTGGYRVQIETNGTLFDESLTKFSLRYNPLFSVVCSPKSLIQLKLMPYITSLKYVLNADHIDRLDGLPKRVMGYNTRPERPWETFIKDKNKVYVQPEFSNDPKIFQRNIDACIQSCMEFGYTLSFQLHKVIGVE